MYIAVHYLKINGTIYTPGEVIRDDLTAEDVERFMSLDAIREPEMPFLAPEPKDEESVDAPDGRGDEGGDGAEDAADDAAAEDAPEDTDGEDYEDAEAPEIDVADSITAPEEEAPEEKKPARGRKGRKE